jgi:hypothetical protein
MSHTHVPQILYGKETWSYRVKKTSLPVGKEEKKRDREPHSLQNPKGGP